MADLAAGDRPLKNTGDLFTRCKQRFGLLPEEVIGILGLTDPEALQAHRDFDQLLGVVEEHLRLCSGRVLMPGSGLDDLAEAIAKAESRAWGSLAKYRFQEFGHYAELWASLVKVSGKQLKNPFAPAASVGRLHRKRSGR